MRVLFNSFNGLVKQVGVFRFINPTTTYFSPVLAWEPFSAVIRLFGSANFAKIFCLPSLCH